MKSICLCSASPDTLSEYIASLILDGWRATERPFIVGELHLCFMTKNLS